MNGREMVQQLQAQINTLIQQNSDLKAQLDAQQVKVDQVVASMTPVTSTAPVV